VTFTVAEQPKRLIPCLEDIQTAGELVQLRKENEVLLGAVAVWAQSINGFIQQVEGSNFTDRNDHAIELNQAYIDLKALVHHDA